MRIPVSGLIKRGLLIFALLTLLPIARAGAASYYINCSAGTNGSGTSSSPWNTLSSANGHSYSPGDSILLLRGTTCNGQLTPTGSGTSASPITIDTYGTGARPTINAGSSYSAVIELYNQSNWVVQNLVLQGGTTYGIEIHTVAGTSISGFTLTNLTATGVTGRSTQRLFSGGEIYISTTNPASETISNVTLNGVQAYSTNIAEGIFISAGEFESNTASKGNNITVENSLVHDVAGDGITVNNAQNVLIQGNIAYNSGQCSSCTGSTPNSIWVYNSTNSDIRYNESYGAKTWSNDGGGYDIDYWDTNGTVEYNYAHDNEGYCVSVFGGESAATTNSIVRYNVCSNNNNQSSYSGVNVPGDIWLYAFDGGSINGVQVYNNTSYWNPVLSNDPELQVNSASGTTLFSGSLPNFYKNNIVYSTGSQVESLVGGSLAFTVDYNDYYTTSGTLYWEYGGNTYSSFSSYVSGSGADTHGINSNPDLNSPTYHTAGISPTAFSLQSGSPAIDTGTNVCASISGTCSPGTHDFFGNPVPQGGGYDIGASEYSGSRVVFVDDSQTGTGSLQFNYQGSWTNCTSACTASTPSMYNMTNSWSSNTNDYVTIQFSGTQVAVIGLLDVNGGLGAVSVDGGSETNVDFYAPTRSGDQLIWTSPFLSAGTHTLKLRVTGTKDSASTGYYVVPDAVRVTEASNYKVMSVLDQQDLDVASSSTSPGAGLVQWDDFNANHQWWTISPNGSDYYLTNQNSSLVAGDPGNSTTQGTQLEQLTYTGAANQLWILQPVSSLLYTYTLENSYSTDDMDVYGNTKTHGAAIDQWSANGDSNQEWVLVPTS